MELERCTVQEGSPASGKSPAMCRELSRLPENMLQLAGSFPERRKAICSRETYSSSILPALSGL